MDGIPDVRRETRRDGHCSHKHSVAHKHVRLLPIIGISIAVQTIVGQAQGMDRPDISVNADGAE